MPLRIEPTTLGKALDHDRGGDSDRRLRGSKITSRVNPALAGLSA
jgi:hypothetical protein